MAVMDSGQSDRYRKLGLTNDYSVYSGKYVLPVAEEAPTDPAELASWVPFDVVAVHAPYRLRVFAYNVDKEQNPPVLPAPEDSGAYKFLAGVYTLPHPSVQTDNSFRWSANVLLTFAEQCASNSDTGFVLGNTVDATQSQYNTAGLGGGVSQNSDAPANVRLGGVGPKVGWVLGNQINLLTASWQYNEPSYFPANLLSSELVAGPTAYNDIPLPGLEGAVQGVVAGVQALQNFFGTQGVAPAPPRPPLD